MVVCKYEAKREIYALKLTKKLKSVTLKNLRSVNRIVKKIHERGFRVKFKKVCEWNELCIIRVGDPSYHTDDISVCGEIILLENRKAAMVSPLFWKSGVIRRVCMSPKAAETRLLVKVVDDSMCFSRKLTRLMAVRMSVMIFTDSRPLLESIGTSGQIEKKLRGSQCHC